MFEFRYQFSGTIKMFEFMMYVFAVAIVLKGLGTSGLVPVP